MSEREKPHVSHEEEDKEVEFKDSVENSTTHSTSPQMVTQGDLQEIIDGWKVKFHQLSEGIRAVQTVSEQFSDNMDRLQRDNHDHMEQLQRDSRAREGAQERRIQEMQEGLACFLERCDPAHLAAARPFDLPCTPVMSTPITPSGIPSRHRPNFHLASPVDQPTRNTDQEFDQRPTHEDDHGNSGDDQCSPSRIDNSGMNNSASRPSSGPKVPIFDGTVSAQFRPWIIQFEAIARHQCWTLGHRVVRLVVSLTGPAANLLIGMTMGQLDDYAFLVARLSRRYNPPEREEAHHAELRARTRRRNESADEFAENLKNLAQRAYTHADQNMLDNLVVERFREGHGNVELKKHLCLYPSTGLQDLIGACVRFETHVELGARAHKSNEGLYTVQANDSADQTLEEVTRTVRRLGFALRPWVDRQQGNRGFNNGGPIRLQQGGSPPRGARPNQNGYSGARPQNPVRRQTPLGEVKCWTCGKTGHYASDCKTNGPKFAFAPKVVRMNYLQDVSDIENEYAPEEQNNSVGND